MDFILQGVVEACKLLVSLDPEVLEVTLRSLVVSGTAVVVAALVGIPLGTALALRPFTGRTTVVAFVHTLMGLPPVVVGLAVVLFLARRGPFGPLELLYSTSGMILAQVILAVPIVTGLTTAALQALDRNLLLQVLALGATPLTAGRCLLWEARRGVMTAVIAAFGRLSAEVGAVMMVGGNIRHETRVLTTATVLEARQGNYERAIALGVILLALSFTINVVLTARQSDARSW